MNESDMTPNPTPENPWRAVEPKEWLKMGDQARLKSDPEAPWHDIEEFDCDSTPEGWEFHVFRTRRPQTSKTAVSSHDVAPGEAGKVGEGQDSGTWTQRQRFNAIWNKINVALFCLHSQRQENKQAEDELSSARAIADQGVGVAYREETSSELTTLRQQVAELTRENKEDREHHEALIGLLKKRFPKREDGTYPDWAIEDVLKENETLTLANELAEHLRTQAEAESKSLRAENDANDSNTAAHHRIQKLEGVLRDLILVWQKYGPHTETLSGGPTAVERASQTLAEGRAE